MIGYGINFVFEFNCDFLPESMNDHLKIMAICLLSLLEA